MTSASVRYCFPDKWFFHVGEQKIDGAKSGEYGGWSTSSKPQSRTAAIATTDLCAGALSWWNRTPFVSFQAVHKMSLVLLFEVLNYLSCVGLSRRKQYSKYQERLNLMHAKCHCCGKTPSLSAYKLFSRPSYTHNWIFFIPCIHVFWSTDWTTLMLSMSPDWSSPMSCSFSYPSSSSRPANSSSNHHRQTKSPANVTEVTPPSFRAECDRPP